MISDLFRGLMVLLLLLLAAGIVAAISSKNELQRYMNIRKM